MKFTLSWLKDHLDTDATLDAIAELLAGRGLGEFDMSQINRD
jgi:phenylalanyl-tRNA synthetase beta chain